MTALLLAALLAGSQDDPGDPFVARAMLAGKELLDRPEAGRRAELIQVLAQYSSDRNPRVSRHALNALVLYVREGLAGDRPADLAAALDVLGKSPHPERDELFRAALDSRSPEHVRTTALRFLAGVGGADFVPELKRRIRDPQLRGTSAWLLGKALKGSGDAEVLALLTEEGGKNAESDDLCTIAFALRAVGGERTRATLKEWIDRLTGWDRTEIAWFVHGIDPMVAVRRLVELGLLEKEPPPESFFPRLEQCQEAGFVSLVLVDAFNDVGQAVRVPEALFPGWDYASILRAFGEAPWSPFDATELRDLPGPDGTRRVEFAHGGSVYRFTARADAIRYDLEGTVEMIRRAMADAGEKRRFHKLSYGCYVLVEPESMAAAAREFFLPLAPGR